MAAALLYGLAFFVGPSVSGVFGNFGQSLAFSLLLAGVGQLVVLLQLPSGLAGVGQSLWQRILDARARQVALSGPPPGELEAEPEREREPEPTPSTRPRHAVPGRSDVPEPASAFEAFEVGVGAEVGAGAEGAEVANRCPVVLEAAGVHVHFGGVVALAGPDICVRAGETVGLIGTNGAGKTTLMNVISGVLQPDRGSVKVFGEEVADLAPDFRAAFGVARSFQDATLFPGLTVTETIQVALGRRNRVGMVSAMVAAPWVRVTERQVLREARQIAKRFGLCLGRCADLAALHRDPPHL